MGIQVLRVILGQKSDADGVDVELEKLSGVGESKSQG